ncbi:low temperature-induced protein [Paenibacillus psychroresistens]|uniref:Low temperature-induced protein n=1 Tax=Paenibacillus psychroresistens TaxID=1778678 RepID=A0A6B8RSK9_9BACL|nr:general stress protein [Paenibacillus psychroresistens]QGQ98919.1 low temperature-induced protein [Paenibacillus psychroresistens]
MSQVNQQKIVGVFQTEQETTRAIEELKLQGYRSDEISIIAKNKDVVATVTEETGSKAPEGVAAGVAAGGMLGGFGGLLLGVGALIIPGVGPFIAAGPIVAILTGAAVGAGAGGLIGGLIGLGIPETEARQYTRYVDDGHILVMVESKAERNGKVYDTFRTHNSVNASSYDRAGVDNPWVR